MFFLEQLCWVELLKLEPDEDFAGVRPYACRLSFLSHKKPTTSLVGFFLPGCVWLPSLPYLHPFHPSPFAFPSLLHPASFPLFQNAVQGSVKIKHTPRRRHPTSFCTPPPHPSLCRTHRRLNKHQCPSFPSFLSILPLKNKLGPSFFAARPSTCTHPLTLHNPKALAKPTPPPFALSVCSPVLCGDVINRVCNNGWVMRRDKKNRRRQCEGADVRPPPPAAAPSVLSAASRPRAPTRWPASSPSSPRPQQTHTRTHAHNARTMRVAMRVQRLWKFRKRSPQ